MMRRTGQTLIEVMLAAIFLATGGLLIYQASSSMMKTEAWKSERLFAQGALRDLVEVCSALDYCELTADRPYWKKLANLTDPEEAAITELVTKEDYQKKFEADDSPLTALRFESFFLMDKEKPIVKTRAEMEQDPVYKAYLATKDRIKLKRAIVVKDDGARAIVVCAVEFQATSSQTVRLKMPLVAFKRPGDCTP